MKKILFPVLVIAAVVVLGLITWVSFSLFSPKESVSISGEESLVPSTPVIEPLTNPVEDKIPDMNPASNTNPFSGTYKNPFE